MSCTTTQKQLELPDLKNTEHNSSSLVERLEFIVNSKDPKYTDTQKEQIKVITPLLCKLHNRYIKREFLEHSLRRKLAWYYRMLYDIDAELFPKVVVFCYRANRSYSSIPKQLKF